MTVLKKKFWIVIALMLVCSLGLGAEKYFTVETKTYFGNDAFVQCLARLNTDDQRIMLEPRGFFVTTPIEYCRFINTVGKKFEFDRFNSNWNDLTELDQIFWLGSHLYVERYEYNIYVLSVRVEAAEPHDYDYVKANMSRLLDEYVAFANAECLKAGVGNLVEFERVELMPEPVKLTRRSIVFKYMTIGAVLGLIAGLIVLFGLSLRKSDDA